MQRRLSGRRSKKNLTDRNIIEVKTPEQKAQDRLSVTDALTRQLSLRSSVSELRERKILKFHEYAEVVETYDGVDYDRSCDKPWTQLTRDDKIFIKAELNDFKRDEMEVHPGSAHLTRFHK